MGRRIAKSRRHKKIKAVDPFYVNKNQGVNIRGKKLFNETPKNRHQEAPRKVNELVNINKKNKFKKHKKKKLVENITKIAVWKDKLDEQQTGMTRPVKYIPPKMCMRKGENESRFLWRIQRVVNTAMAEAQMEQKYGIDSVGKKNEQISMEEKPVVKKQISIRKQSQMEESLDAEEAKTPDDFNHLKDDIKFGEVVLQPPQLLTHWAKNKVKKPESKSLLLNKFLPSENSFCRRKFPKLKQLSSADQRILAAERQRAIDAYQQLKRNKRNKL